MAITLGAPPLAGFDQPIDLMMDCHRRIERFLDVLVRVAEQAAESGDGSELDDEHRDALRTALEYFAAAAPRHTEDEENSLFPLMRDNHDPGIRAAIEQIDRMESDHRTAAAIHAQFDPLAHRLLSDRRLASEVEARRLIDLSRQLRDLYRAHIEVEDQVLFPLARRALSDEQLRQIGDEMLARREDNPGRPSSRCGQRRRALRRAKRRTVR